MKPTLTDTVSGALRISVSNATPTIPHNAMNVSQGLSLSKASVLNVPTTVNSALTANARNAKGVLLLIHKLTPAIHVTLDASNVL